MAGPRQSQEREKMAQMAEVAAAQREQAAEARRWRKELRYQTERYLERITYLAALLWPRLTPLMPSTPVYPSSGEEVEELHGAPWQPEVVDEVRDCHRIQNFPSDMHLL